MATLILWPQEERCHSKSAGRVLKERIMNRLFIEHEKKVKDVKFVKEPTHVQGYTKGAEA